MPLALIRPGQLYAWRGSSLLLLNTNGECGQDDQLSGYYFREARFLRTVRLEINRHAPWLCDAMLLEPHALALTHIYPELTEFGGGGSGQSGDQVSTDADGVPHRALSLRVVHTVSLAGLTVRLTISNHAPRRARRMWHGTSMRTSQTFRRRTEADASSRRMCNGPFTADSFISPICIPS